MGYYSPFHGPLITILGSRSDFHHRRSPRAFTSWSSTLAVLADSGPLHGLLFTVSWAIIHQFGFPELFPSLTKPSVHFVLVINTRSFGRFWPITWATNHRFMGH